MNRDGVERGIVLLGLLPLLAGAAWLVLLREPPAVAAAGGLPPPAVSAPLPEPVSGASSWLGLIVAGRDADLAAELAGQVVAVFAEPGERVRSGQPILELSAVAVLGAAGMARAQYDQDRSAERAAELALETARDKASRMLQARHAYPESELRAVQAEERQREAELAKLRAKSALERAALRRELARAEMQVVRAPFDGVLAGRHVDVGDFVAPGSALARLVDDARFVRFAVPAEHHAGLAPGAKLTLVPSGQSLPLTATLLSVEPELEAAAGVGFARAELDVELARSRGLVPGRRVAVLAPAPEASR